MYLSPGAARVKQVTDAEATVLATCLYTAGAGANLIGLHVHASVADATSVRVWAGLTATATGTAIGTTGAIEQGRAITGLVTFASVARATYLNYPAYASSGCVIVTTGSAPVSLYWNPA